MKIACIWEHNGNDSLLYAEKQIGAFTRGESKAVAIAKMPREIAAYCAWAGMPAPAHVEVEIVEEKASDLAIRDADSDVLFASEKAPLPPEVYASAKALALRSAADFRHLYAAVPDPDLSMLPARETFYGAVPRTAREMYVHTKNVNAYYFGEINVDADNEGDILTCREAGFALLEQVPDFLRNPVIAGSYGEEWTLRKVLRRFVWHDRIHARAMYRMAIRTFGAGSVPDIFHFAE